MKTRVSYRSLLQVLTVVSLCAVALSAREQHRPNPPERVDTVVDEKPELALDPTPSPQPLALAAPGDPVRLTIIKETVDVAGSPMTTPESFDFTVIAADGSRNVVPPLDTDPATARPDRAVVSIVAGKVTVFEQGTPGWALRTLRCGTTDFTPLYDNSTRQWFADITITGDATCTAVNSNDGALLTIVKRTVDATGTEIPVATDFPFQVSDRFGFITNLTLDTDPLSAPPAAATVSGQPGSYQLTEVWSQFGTPLSFVCGGNELPITVTFPFVGLPLYQSARFDVRGPMTCVVTNVRVEGAHVVRVVHRTVDEAGNDISSNEPFGIRAQTPESGPVNLTLDTDPATATANLGNVVHRGGVGLLTYTPRSGWTLSSVACDGRPAAITNNTVSYPLFRNHECVFTSRRGSSAPPPSGHALTIVKRTLDAAGNPFAANDAADSFSFFAFDGAYFEFATLDTNPATADTDRFAFQPPANAFVSLSEILPSSDTRKWLVDSIACDRDAGIGTTGLTILMTAPATCTFTNRLAASTARLTVTKRTVDRNGALLTSGGPFFIEVSGAGGNGASFSLDTDPATLTRETDSSVLPNGRLRLSESPPVGWRFDSLVCDNATPFGVPAASGRAFEFDLTIDTTCIVTNRQAAIEVTIQKVTINAAGAPIESDTVFSITTVGAITRTSTLDTSPATSFRIDRQVFTSAAGIHEITELVPRAWELASVTCNGTPATVNATTATVDLQTDSICILTNRQRPGVAVSINKETVSSTGAPIESLTEFRFTATGTVEQFLTLDTSPLTTLPATGALSLPLGSYRVTEAAPLGWRLASVTCTGATPSQSGASFVIDVAGPVSCTVRNEQLADATLRIVKTTTGPGGTPTASATAFAFDRTDDGGTDFSLDTAPATAMPDSTVLTLTPGVAVTVRELVPAGWQLVDISCSGGSTLVLQGSASEPLGVRVNPPAGATITCTFRNQSAASSLTVLKETVDASGARVTSADEFVITSTTPGVGSFSVDTDPGTARPASREVAVLPGSIALTEAPVAPWALAAVTCTVEHTVTRDGSGRLTGVTVEVEAGQRAVCVFTNERPTTGTARLVVRKVTEAADGTVISSPTDFTLRGSGAIGTVVVDTDPLDAVRADSAERSLAAGAYSITEDATAGWSLRTITCTGATSAINRTPLAGVDLTLAPGQQVECVFANRAIATIDTATLTIRKEGRLPAGLIGPVLQEFRFSGTGPIGDFTLDLNAGSATPVERTFTVAPGAYSVIERDIPGDFRSWDLEDIACINAPTADINGGTTGEPGLIGTTVTLVAGTAAVCNFVNRGGGVTFDMFLDTVDANGFIIRDEQDFTYTLSAGATTIETFALDTGTGTPPADRRFVFTPGVYRIVTTPIAGWELIDVRCDELAAPVLDGAGRLIGADIIISAVQDFRDCRFVHRRASLGTATITIAVETRSHADFNVPVEAAGDFHQFLTSLRGDVLREFGVDTSPATARPTTSATVVEAGFIGWLPTKETGLNTLWAPVTTECRRGATLLPLTVLPLGRDLTNDQVNDNANFFTANPGDIISCLVIEQEQAPPAQVKVQKRVVDSAGTVYRYEQPFTYRVTAGNGNGETRTVATTDNFIYFLQGSPGTWSIIEQQVATMPFSVLTCSEEGTGALVATTPLTNSFGRGASFVAPPGARYFCYLDNVVTNPGYLTLNKRLLDINGNEIGSVDDFRMFLNPVVGNFTIDVDPTDQDRILFEEYTRTRRMALPAGTYRFVENATADYSLQEMTCTGGAVTLIPGPGRINGADIVVGAGANVVCDLVNGPGSSTTLRVRKNTLTTGGRLFQDPTRFTFNAPGQTFQLASLPGGGVSNERVLSIAANRTVRITEDQIAGWRLTDITCSTGIVTPVRDTANLLIGMDIVVGPNESPTCSFSNSSDQTRLTVAKVTERGGATITSTQAFAFRGDAGAFTLDTSTATTAVPNEVSFARTAGAVTVLEDAVSGWSLDRVTCVEASGRTLTTAPASAGTSAGIAVTMIAGDQVRCTFVNVEGVAPPPVNRAPVCLDRTGTVTAGAFLDIAPSCTDPDNDTFVVTLGTTAPTKGTVAIVAGQLRYTANPGTSGTDTFTYLATDTAGLPSTPATVTITITTPPPPPPPAPPALTVANVSVVEGTGAGTTTLRFVLRLSAPAPTGGASVAVATAPGSATSPADYTHVARTVAFSAGQQEANVDIAVERDALDETDETLRLIMSTPTGMTLTAAEATGTIIDDDEPALPPVTVTITDFLCIEEGQPNQSTRFEFIVTLSAPAQTGGVTIGYRTVDGEARAGVDYLAATGTVTIPAGQRTATIVVLSIGDSNPEGNEDFWVELTTTTGNAILGNPRRGQGVLFNDDGN